MDKLTFIYCVMDRFMAASKILGEETANASGVGAGAGTGVGAGAGAGAGGESTGQR